ncbi:hypothetical protein [Kitasatospora sp. NPDC094015]|uniref:hypothetical protein n=1 Tax=Kitasatospora sp. NPDC094015 TaxID=3155205 RepID=UPI00331F6D8E
MAFLAVTFLLAGCGTTASTPDSPHPESRSSSSSIPRVPPSGLQSKYRVAIPEDAVDVTYGEKSEWGRSDFWVSFRLPAEKAGDFLKAIGLTGHFRAWSFPFTPADLTMAGWQVTPGPNTRGGTIPVADDSVHAPSRSVVIDQSVPDWPKVYALSSIA